MKSKDIIISKLEKLGLSSKEGEVYLQLVKNPYSNGSQIAKKLGYPRTSIYSILSKLQGKGYILSLPEGEITSYAAINPQDLIFRLKKEVKDATNILDEEFKKIDIESTDKQFLNIKSEDRISEKIHELLENAEKEVYINTNLSIEEFQEYKEDFELLKEKGVRVVVFSFQDRGYEKLGVETHFREALKKDASDKNKRILLVVDMKLAIMASNYGGDFYGTFSENKLLINLIAEHIHNDIYLKKLESNYKGDFWKDIKLNTIQEIENRH